MADGPAGAPERPSTPWNGEHLSRPGSYAGRVRPLQEGCKADSRRNHGSTSMASNSPASTSSSRVTSLREALASRVVVADGAMGTMLQAQDPTMEDFQQLE